MFLVFRFSSLFDLMLLSYQAIFRGRVLFRDFFLVFKESTQSPKNGFAIRELRVVFGKLRIEIITFLENCESNF